MAGPLAVRVVFDFDIQKCARRCIVTDREFQPGDVVYSTLVSEGVGIVRRDYAEEAWRGPPENEHIIGWWKSRIPDPRAKTMHWAPNDVMLHYFTELERRKDGQDTRYILALLMIRRRVLRLEESERDRDGRESLVLFCPRNETEYRVPVTMPSEERIAEIRQELAKLLCSDAA